jgi:hypothetical protein
MSVFAPYSSSEAAQFNRRSRKILVSARDAIVSRYLAGESSELIALDYGVRGAAILYHVKKAGFFKDRISSRRNSLDEAAFDALTPASAYWIGFLMADGWIAKDYSEFSIALAFTDRCHLWRFRAFLGSSARTPIHAGKKGHATVRLSVRSRHMCESLATHGVTPQKTHTAKALGQVEGSADFWRGMMDGDGSLGIHADHRYKETKGSATISLCGTEAILQQFRRFVEERVPNTKSTVRRHSANLFNIAFGGRTAVAVAALLYSGAEIALPRKEATAKDIAAWATYDRTLCSLRSATHGCPELLSHT